MQKIERDYKLTCNLTSSSKAYHRIYFWEI